MHKNQTNVDPEEIEKFAALASHWWDTSGELKTLHQLNPLRIEYISNKVNLSGKKALDIGCGGGILSESLTQLGAEVTGIDLNKAAIDIAKLHTLETKVKVNYQVCSAEEMAKNASDQYDLITCLEMLEHVPDPSSIIAACMKLLRPGGLLFCSTINRNPKAYLFAILGAEYVLRILPKHTHDYAKFIKPSELSQWIRDCGGNVNEIKGIQYQPFTEKFSMNDDVSVNYILLASKPND